MAQTGVLKKPVNGEHTDDSPATHPPHEPELLGGLPSKFDAGEDMPSRGPGEYDSAILQALKEQGDTLREIKGSLSAGGVTKTPNWVIPIITTILLGLVALTFKSITDSVARIEAKQDKLETYNQRTREEFALHGWHIDPETGKITKIQPQKETP